MMISLIVAGWTVDPAFPQHNPSSSSSCLSFPAPEDRLQKTKNSVNRQNSDSDSDKGDEDVSRALNVCTRSSRVRANAAGG